MLLTAGLGGLLYGLWPLLTRNYTLFSLVQESGVYCLLGATFSRSLLTNMVVCGYNASGTVIPFLTNTFAYQGNPNGVSFGPTIMWTNLNISDPGSSTVYYPEVAQVYLDDNGDNYTVADLVDIDGDGLPDRVVYDSTTSPNQFDVQKNLGMQGNSFGQFSTNS